MRRIYLMLITVAILLLALQALLLASWSRDGTKTAVGKHQTAAAQQQLLHNLLAESQQVQNLHSGLQSQVQQLEDLHTSGHQSAGAKSDQHNSNMRMRSDDPACISNAPNPHGSIAAVVIITYNRPEYLQKCISSVLNVHVTNPDNRQKFPLHISQDGNNTAVAELARSKDPAVFNMSHVEPGLVPSIFHMQHIEQDNFPTRKKAEPVAYYRIASHYKFVMQQIFDCWQYPKLIILEDDMRLAVDFFTYFEAGVKLLDDDPSLYCISSWNDHGQEIHVQDPLRLERSDFFPGLGWMLTNALWQSLKSSWPAAYWDDWMRLSSVRKGRQCIRPEICRTYNFGEKGSSHGQYYDRYLKPIKLNDAWVNWGGQDLGYLDSEKYAEEMTATVALAEPVALHVDNLHSKQGVIKMMYSSRQEYEQLASVLGIIDDWKDGVPRASYKGIVKVRLNREAAAADEIRGECLLVPLPTNQTDAHRSPKAKLPVDILRTG